LKKKQEARSKKQEARSKKKIPRVRRVFFWTLTLVG